MLRKFYRLLSKFLVVSLLSSSLTMVSFADDTAPVEQPVLSNESIEAQKDTISDVLSEVTDTDDSLEETDAAENKEAHKEEIEDEIETGSVIDNKAEEPVGDDIDEADLLESDSLKDANSGEEVVDTLVEESEDKTTDKAFEMSIADGEERLANDLKPEIESVDEEDKEDEGGMETVASYTVATPSNISRVSEEKDTYTDTDTDKEAEIAKEIEAIEKQIEALEADGLDDEIELKEYELSVQKAYSVGIDIEDKIESIDDEIAILEEKIENRDFPKATPSNAARIDSMDKEPVEVSEKIIILPEPVKEGYKFLYWSDNKDGNGNIYYAGDEYELNGSEISLYAIWEDDEDFYLAHEEKEIEKLKAKIAILEAEKKNLKKEARREADEEKKALKRQEEYLAKLEELNNLKMQKEKLKSSVASGGGNGADVNSVESTVLQDDVKPVADDMDVGSQDKEVLKEPNEVGGNDAVSAEKESEEAESHPEKNPVSGTVETVVEDIAIEETVVEETATEGNTEEVETIAEKTEGSSEEKESVHETIIEESAVEESEEVKTSQEESEIEESDTVTEESEESQDSKEADEDTDEETVTETESESEEVSDNTTEDTVEGPTEEGN